MLVIKSKSHDYIVEDFSSFAATLASIRDDNRKVVCVVDKVFGELYRDDLAARFNPGQTLSIEASEGQKRFERLTPLFLELLERGLRRDSLLIVIGGGVLQDIGCFIASVLFRGVQWELIPTTLLAQADSCIGSKSSINIGSYKNQIGTFYPPHRVLLTSSILATLPRDEVRSGMGEVIKLQLLSGEEPFRELIADLEQSEGREAILEKWIKRSLQVKKRYIEEDEFDRGARNLLNYGHTFGHAYESATGYGIPHGIAVVLGILTATLLSSRMGLVSVEHYRELRELLRPWHHPFGELLRAAPRGEIFSAIKRDKKNTANMINCILTRGPGAMEKRPVTFEEELVPVVNVFLDEIGESSKSPV